MNTKILVPAVLITALTVAVAGTFAATSSSTSSGNTQTQNQFSGKGFAGMGGHRGGPMGGMMTELTDAEKTALESMSDSDKQAFFEKKRTETEAKRDAREAVIDKLLAGTALTSEEETIKQEIIKQRAEMKVKRAEMEANRTKMEVIRAKQKAGTTLTSEEQAIVDSMPKGGHGGRGGKMRNQMTTAAQTTPQVQE